MKWVKFLFPPLLVVALIGSSLFWGAARPGATRTLTVSLLHSESLRQGVAASLVDQLIDSDDVLLKAMLTANRNKAENAIAASLGTDQEISEISDATESITSAMFTGKESVTIDSTPIYRPIYGALDSIFPVLNLTENNLKDAEPVVLGSDSPLPNLAPVRTALTASIALWALLLLMTIIYIRKWGRPGGRLIARQTLIISLIAAVLSFGVPYIIGSALKGALQQILAETAIRQLAIGSLWLSLLLVVLSSGGLISARERVLPSQDSTQSE